MQKSDIGLHGVFLSIALSLSRLCLLGDQKRLTNLRYLAIKALTFFFMWLIVHCLSLIIQGFSWSFFNLNHLLISFIGAILFSLPGLGHFDNLKNEYKLNGKSDLID